MGFTYKRIITDEEEKILADQYIDPWAWIDDAIVGAISRCTGHCAKRRHIELLKHGDKMVPAKEIDLVKSAFADPEYKNRKERDKKALI